MSHGAAQEAPKLRWWVGFLINVSIGLLFALFAQYLPSSEAAKRVVTRIWSPLVTQHYSRTGRDQVTVMLIDDLDLSQYDETWPVSLGFHARRLHELLKYGPKAVFFDIAFLDNRHDPDLDAFIDTACRARAQGVPVFIGSFGNAGLAPSRVEAAMLARRVEVAGESRPCIEAAYLNLKIDGFDQSVWEYDLGLPPGAPGHAEGGHEAHGDGAARYPSPAARLYAVDHELDAEALERPLALVWGTASAPFNLGWMRNPSHDVGSGPSCAPDWEWERLLPVGKLGAPLCPYQTTLPIRTLKLANGVSADGLREAIGGKYLIYGTHLQSAADTITSPYHGRIAGAYLHAMALDNLLSFDGKPRLAGEFGEAESAETNAFTVFAVLVICAFIAFKERVMEGRLEGWIKKRTEPQTAAAERYRTGLGARDRVAGLLLAMGRQLAVWLFPRLVSGVVALLVIAVLVKLSYDVLRLGPMVWVEYALFPLGMHFLHIGEKIEAALAWTGEQWSGPEAHEEAAAEAGPLTAVAPAEAMVRTGR